MPEKFRNKYRIPSARLQNWDYGANGAYFITICTKNMNHFFGEIVDKKMNLNAAGTLAEEYWIEIVKQFPFIELGNFQIMPNHMHGILTIDKSREFVKMRVMTSEHPQREIGGFAGENNPMLLENIATIIRWYKGRCTFEIRKTNKNFEWHSRFHDHIIRNSESFERIQNYIVENPSKWDEDKFFKK